MERNRELVLIPDCAARGQRGVWQRRYLWVKSCFPVHFTAHGLDWMDAAFTLLRGWPSHCLNAANWRLARPSLAGPVRCSDVLERGAGKGQRQPRYCAPTLWIILSSIARDILQAADEVAIGKAESPRRDPKKLWAGRDASSACDDGALFSRRQGALWGGVAVCGLANVPW